MPIITFDSLLQKSIQNQDLKSKDTADGTKRLAALLGEKRGELINDEVSPAA